MLLNLPVRCRPFVCIPFPERERGEFMCRYLPNPAMPVSIPLAQLLPVAHGRGVLLKISSLVGTVMLITVFTLVW